MKNIRAILFSLTFASSIASANLAVPIEGRVINRDKSKIVIKAKDKTYTIRFSEIKNKDMKRRVKRTVPGKKISLLFPLTQKMTARSNNPHKSKER